MINIEFGDCDHKTFSELKTDINSQFSQFFCMFFVKYLIPDAFTEFTIYN